MRHRLALYSLSLVLFVTIWFALSLFTPHYLLPTPLDVVRAFIEMTLKESLLIDIMVTLGRVLLGFSLGLLIGLTLAIASMMYNMFRDIIYPLVAFISVTPSFAFIPLLMIWIGLNDMLAIAAVAICVGFPIVYSFISSKKSIDPEIINVALTLGASRKDLVFKVILPLSITHLAPLLKLEAGHSWKMVFVTEYLALSSGLGFLMVRAYSMISVDKIIALIILLGLLALVFQYIIELIETRIMRKWGYMRRLNI